MQQRDSPSVAWETPAFGVWDCYAFATNKFRVIRPVGGRKMAKDALSGTFIPLMVFVLVT